MNARRGLFRLHVPVFLLLLAFGVARAGTLPGPLVTASWLHDHLDQVQVVDIRDNLNALTEPPRYLTIGGRKVLVESGGHIPGALSVNVAALREPRRIDGRMVRFMLPAAEDFQGVMQASQLQRGKPVVLVPTGDHVISLQEAALLAFELQVFGQPPDQVAILNGGMHAWIKAGYPVDTDAIAPLDPGNWKASSPRNDMLADVARVKKAQRTPGHLVDARPLAQFAALDHTPVIPLSARLAGARSLPTELLYKRAKDGSWRFLTPTEYRHVLKTQGIGKLSPSIVYCNTGQYASGAWFVLARILGLEHVREFQGGMNEWLHRGLPVIGLDGQQVRWRP
jgi:thiosulfate/3-mercaptopyruvate sulfurtransferase